MPIDDGFFFEQLSEFKQELLRSVVKDFPIETRKFVKKQALGVSKTARKIAKREVGTAKGKKKNWIEDKSYHKRFKAGRPYNYSSDICCRAYNSSPVAHLIEEGHMNVPKSEKRETTRAGRIKQKQERLQRLGNTFTPGKHIYKKAELEYTNTYLNETDEFLYQFFDDLTNKATK